MAKATFVNKARKNYKQHGIKKGESYWWWSFRFGGKHYSLTPPKQSQLTQSAFFSELYSIEEDMDELTCTDKDEFDSAKQEILDRIESLKDETEGKRENMPESLQDGDTGILLQERVDGLESWYNEIEAVECEYEEDDIRSELKDEDEDLSEEQLDEQVAEKVQEVVDESIQAIKDCTHGL